MQQLTLPRGGVLLRQGEVASGIYFITKGAAACAMRVPGGPEQNVLQIGPGSTAGELSAYNSTEQAFSVVATVDGQTYERSAIEHWLRDHNTSPLTGEVLAMKMLIPNHTVRGLSRKWLEEHPDGEEHPAGEEVKGPTMVRGNDEWPSLS